MLWIILGVVVLLVVVLVLFYNRLVRLRNRVENAWAQVDVQLKRRYDLIPNLVETVKGYAAHERETFEAVTNARARAQAAQGPAEQGAAEGILGQALGRLFAVAEAYPELQAGVFFAGPFGFAKRDFFEVEDEAREAPRVAF
jgi:LemA protein